MPTTRWDIRSPNATCACRKPSELIQKALDFRARATRSSATAWPGWNSAWATRPRRCASWTPPTRPGRTPRSPPTWARCCGAWASATGRRPSGGKACCSTRERHPAGNPQAAARRQSMSRTAVAACAQPRVALAVWLASFALALLAGCASPPRATGPVDPVTGPGAAGWRCRYRIRRASRFRPRSNSRVRPASGELTLFSPLGGTLAVLAWPPGAATLNSNGQTRQFDSVDALVAHVTGSAIPVAALFDWLRGIDTPVPGWHADLSQLAQGRVAAKRLEPHAGSRPAHRSWSTR